MLSKRKNSHFICWLLGWICKRKIIRLVHSYTYIDILILFFCVCVYVYETFICLYPRSNSSASLVCYSLFPLLSHFAPCMTVKPFDFSELAYPKNSVYNRWLHWILLHLSLSLSLSCLLHLLSLFFMFILALSFLFYRFRSFLSNE